MQLEIMVMVTTAPVYLERAVAVSWPDKQGMVQLEHPVYAGETLGYITQVSATLCLAYDDTMMTVINQLTGIGIEYYKAARMQAETCRPAFEELGLDNMAVAASTVKEHWH